MKQKGPSDLPSRRGAGEGSEELSEKVILNFCPEMIFSHYVINIYLIPLLALLDLTV